MLLHSPGGLDPSDTVGHQDLSEFEFPYIAGLGPILRFEFFSVFSLKNSGFEAEFQDDSSQRVIAQEARIARFDEEVQFGENVGDGPTGNVGVIVLAP